MASLPYCWSVTMLGLYVSYTVAELISLIFCAVVGTGIIFMGYFLALSVV
ncbi:MAG: hypothetical protein RIM23_20815 [Coleofasciculus sp. G3-WIS-01]